MSSLAASRADNFYYPPEWRPEYGGISKFAGSKGANQYEQFGIIRFELPFDGWCLGCKKHISKGTRFNAKKDKAGKYFTTTIHSFDMKCAGCDQRFLILTDPENGTYNFKDGIRKHEQDFVPDFEDGMIVADSSETRTKIASDPMFRLQHQHEDYVKARTEAERFEHLSSLQDDNHKQDYDMNSLLRKGNRERKRKAVEQLENGRVRNLAIPLLDANEEDHDNAKLVNFASKSNRFRASETQKFIEAKAKPLLGDAGTKKHASKSNRVNSSSSGSGRGSSSSNSSSSKGVVVVHSSSTSSSSSNGGKSRSITKAQEAQSRIVKALKTQSKFGIDPTNLKLGVGGAFVRKIVGGGGGGDDPRSQILIKKNDKKKDREAIDTAKTSALDLLNNY